MNNKWPNIWYLPMSLVVNQNKQPVKTRNVYDASARYQGTSLNDNLSMGPNLLVDIMKPLMRVRMHKYAFTSTYFMARKPKQSNASLYSKGHVVWS